MKILIVNTYDYGGAANACKRLHLGLLNEGIDSKVLLRNKLNHWPESFQFEPMENEPKFFEKLNRKISRLAQELKLYKKQKVVSIEEDFLNKRPKELELFSFPESNYDITQSPLYKEADIINLHWVANFLDFESFFLKNIKPVVWTLHDMNPFTGGEHYKEKFLGLDVQGEPLERIYSKHELELSKFNTELKKRILSQTDDLHIVSPSKWLAKEAAKSEVFGKFSVRHIPYALDPDIYKPMNKEYSKELLNIPQGKKVILFVADSLNNSRKGFSFLKEAFNKLDQKDITLCAIGKITSNLNYDNLIELGEFKDERLLRAAYSAADVFVIPSLMDNLPNTVLESLMCGTPVIGFPVGGIPDMIKNGENGLITEEISVSSLHNTIFKFFNSPNIFYKEKIREEAIKRYDYKIQAESYISLFDDIYNKNSC